MEWYMYALAIIVILIISKLFDQSHRATRAEEKIMSLSSSVEYLQQSVYQLERELQAVRRKDNLDR